MKFKYFNLTAIKENYRQQIDQFIIDYVFLFPFTPGNAGICDLYIRASMVILITEDSICVPYNEYTWDDLTLEELELIIEKVFEPALIKYETHEKGTLN